MAKKQTKKERKKSAVKSSKTTAVIPTKKRLNIKSLRLRRDPKPDMPKLSSAWRLFRRSLSMVRQNAKLFIGLTLVYVVLTLLLVRGFGATLDISGIRESISESSGGNVSALASAATLLGILITGEESMASEDGAAYQTFLVIGVSLATIWCLRKIASKQEASVKGGFYKGMHSLVPFILTLCIVGLQLIPAAIGTWLYSGLLTSGLAATGVEQVLWGSLMLALVGLSIYLFSSSLFGLVIVTLPDMTPFKALRSARTLVKHQRWAVLRKLLFLPLGLLLLVAVVMMPFLVFIPQLSEWVFLSLSLFSWVFAITYIYNLYWELIGE